MKPVAPFPVGLRVVADITLGEDNPLLGEVTLHPVAVTSPLSHVQCHTRLRGGDTAVAGNNPVGRRTLRRQRDAACRRANDDGQANETPPGRSGGKGHDSTPCRARMVAVMMLWGGGIDKTRHITGAEPRSPARSAPPGGSGRPVPRGTRATSRGQGDRPSPRR